eukprot:6181137-Pleurochrysis_carterae.AAC.3
MTLSPMCKQMISFQNVCFVLSIETARGESRSESEAENTARCLAFGYRANRKPKALCNGVSGKRHTTTTRLAIQVPSWAFPSPFQVEGPHNKAHEPCS